MLSLIICGRTVKISSYLEKNIDNTIGVPYEIIWIDNSSNRYSIFQAYNIGVEESAFPFLCFMHDDIKYHSKDWGVNVTNHFNDVHTGAIGIAGGAYLTYMPSPWWVSGINYEYLVNVNKGKASNKELLVGGVKAIKNEVVSLDGVWFCIKKQLFEQIRFDENCYDGFHFYDLDICAQIKTLGYKLFCVSDVLVEHKSDGCLDETWMKNALIFQKKWKSYLPLKAVELESKESWIIEMQALSEFIAISKKYNVSEDEIYRKAFSQLFSYPTSFLHISRAYFLLKFLVKSLI